MLSGIGPRAQLESLGIDVIVGAPAVGSNLQDHIYAHVYTMAAAGVAGSVPLGLGEADTAAWLRDHKGPSSYFPENNVDHPHEAARALYEIHDFPGSSGSRLDPYVLYRTDSTLSAHDNCYGPSKYEKDTGFKLVNARAQ